MLGIFEPDLVIPALVLAIPIVAIIGGIIAGIVRQLGQQRLAELAQRERIAAIERGVDPSKLPPPPMLDADASAAASPTERARRQAMWILVYGVITIAAGIGLSAFLTIVEPARDVWAVGLIPSSVGIALVISSFIVRPRGGSRD